MRLILPLPQELRAVMEDLLQPLEKLHRVVGFATEELEGDGVGHLTTDVPEGPQAVTLVPEEDVVWGMERE